MRFLLLEPPTTSSTRGKERYRTIHQNNNGLNVEKSEGDYSYGLALAKAETHSDIIGYLVALRFFWARRNDIGAVSASASSQTRNLKILEYAVQADFF